MPEDLEAFAAGDDDALWRRRASHRLQDPRAVMQVPGVANRDARKIYDARVQRIRGLIESDDRDALSIELAEAVRMAVWRGQSITGWDAFAENILGLAPDEARAMAEQGLLTTGGSGPAPDETVAVWMRAEAGLLDCQDDAVVRLRGEGDDARLHFDVKVSEAALGLSEVGRRMTPVAREQAEAPTSVLDRPKGVPRINRLIERQMGPKDED